MQPNNIADELFAEEPNYDVLAQQEDVNAEILGKLLDAADPALASRVLSLAGQLAGQFNCKQSVKLIREGASNTNEDVRIGAAIGACLAPFNPRSKLSRQLIEQLLNDPAKSVRHVIVSALPSDLVEVFRKSLESIARNDPDENVRAEARDRLTDKPRRKAVMPSQSVAIGDGLEEYTGGALEITCGDGADQDSSVIPINAILPAIEI